MLVTKRNGEKQELNLDKIHAVLSWACDGQNDDNLTPIKGVSVSQIEMNAKLHFYDGIPTQGIHEILIKAASELITEDYPNYAQVAARLVWFEVRKNAFQNNMPPHLYQVVEDNIRKGIYTKEILDFYTKEEIDELNKMIDHKRDDLFKYAGAEQMRKKYLAQNRKTKTVYESFQFPYILVAAILFAKYPKDKRMEYVKEYYDFISQHDISLPTPIMAGVRTNEKQFSSCTLIEAGDSLKSINSAASAIVEYASRKAGIGLSIGKIRADQQPVRNGSAITTGVVPFAKYFNAALKSCSQGAVRGASATFNYPIWHLEFERLIELKNNKGTEETRLRTVDYCVHLNKLFYERLINNSHITFFSPEEVPDLYDAFYSNKYKEFEKLYKQYEKDHTKTKKKLMAMDVFVKIIQERFETGRIYLMNADTVNIHGSLYEPIKMTNLCLTGDTRIVTDKGLKTLKELYDTQETFLVSSDKRSIEGSEIILKHGNGEEQRYHDCLHDFGTSTYEASKVFMTNPSAEVFEVITASGYKIKGTADHKIMTNTGWKMIKDLHIEDNVYIQSGDGLFPQQCKLNVEPIAFKEQFQKEKELYIMPKLATSKLGELLGWIINKGYIENKTNWLHLFFHDKEEQIAIQFEKYIKTLIPHVAIEAQTKEQTKEIIVKNEVLGQWLKAIGVNQENQKKTIPEFMWNANKETVEGFLRGFFTSGKEKHTHSNECIISLYTEDRKILEEVSVLLSNFGIRSSVYIQNSNGFRVMTKEADCHESYGLNIKNMNVQTFKEKIGFLIENHKDNVVTLKSFVSSKMTNYPNAEYYEDSIVAVNFVGIEEVYDLSVNESHSFIANGIVVHNCTEITQTTTQMADIDEMIALCTLSAINWGKFVPFGDLKNDEKALRRQKMKLQKVCELAVRGLDALLDYQEYPLEASKRHTQRYRPLGIGIIGFAHWLAKGRLSWGAENTLKEVEEMMEHMAYYLTEASIDLAKEYGEKGAIQRTKYHDGIFPIDTSTLKAKTTLDWDRLKEKAKKYGIRNATLMALMPSETSSQLANETNGIEPPKSLVTIKGSKDGVLSQTVPEIHKLSAYYETLWQVPAEDYLKTIAVLQKYIDQAISINTSYNPNKKEVTISKLLSDVLLAYKLGHKTLYYNNTNDGSGDTSDDGCESGACKI